MTTAIGLSPRVRGNQGPVVPVHPGDGSIPACAGEPRQPLPGPGAQRVYPRVCGGTTKCRGPRPIRSGLSPRVRGNPGRSCSSGCQRRSIPACAGEPRACDRIPAAHEVYPRVCGGTLSCDIDGPPAGGLSPRVRGNRVDHEQNRMYNRSIPACAGEPGDVDGEYGSHEVYPRVCGGTASAVTKHHPSSGLSPRVRGNRQPPSQSQSHVGSIPACAGEPSACQVCGCWSGVYPRVCGGTVDAGMGAYLAKGLSPRVRGNPCGDDQERAAFGSIPACAGEPTPRKERERRESVYPRVCGGTMEHHGTAVHTRGLSPRVRGNQRWTSYKSKSRRSIPACAGEPSAGRPARQRCRVYPRVCGGTNLLGSVWAGQTGLSPRVRGNPFPTHPQVRQNRSIPACAGEPMPFGPISIRKQVYPRVCGGTHDGL